MVESVKFDGKDGYISKKIAEPTCGVRYYGKEFRRYRRTPFTDEEKALYKAVFGYVPEDVKSA